MTPIGSWPIVTPSPGNGILALKDMVDGAGNPIVVGSGLAKTFLQEAKRLGLQIQISDDAEFVHLSGCCRADAMELADRQALDNGWSHLGRDDELAVQLVLVRCHFSQELVEADPGRDGQLVSSRILARISRATCVA